MKLSALLAALNGIKTREHGLSAVPPEDIEVDISLDISRGEDDAGRRAFAGGYVGTQKNGPGWYTMMFDGTVNEEQAAKKKKRRVSPSRK